MLFTLSTAVLLNALALLTPSTKATPVNLVEARALPTPVSVAIAMEYLAALTIKPEAHGDTYAPGWFPYWIETVKPCTTRETVIIRDGTNVVHNHQCQVISGHWYSAYDGVAHTSPGRIQVDHLVPLYDAWVSGASAWTTDERELFANDLGISQLITVTGSVHEAKNGSDPAKWMPPLASFHCTYVRSWITVKHRYKLAVDQEEYDALFEYLNTCPDDDA